MNQKGALLAILVAMAVFALLQARGGLIGVPKKDVRSAAVLSAVASELNKQLPKAVDAETELASVAGLEGVIVYNYRLVKRAANELDTTAFLGSMQLQVSNAVCTTPESRDKFLNQGVTMRYTYVDRNNAPIATFDVTRAACGP